MLLNEPRPRVLLADDYHGILVALERLLADSCDVVGCVDDGLALLEAASRLQPDVIVLDLNMPSLPGLEACRRIKQAAPIIKIIILTGTDDDAVKEKALSLGASAFVLKHGAEDTLLPAIQKAFLGDGNFRDA